MKVAKILFAAALTALTMTGCQNNKDNNDMENPFLVESPLPHGATQFDKIRLEHYRPAFEAGIEEQNREIDAIVNNPEAPTFENTIVALDRSGRLLDRVGNIFYNLLECNGTDEMHALSEELQPMMSQHSLDISLNEGLFARIQQVWEMYQGCTVQDAQCTVDGSAADSANSASSIVNPAPLTTEQYRLLKDTYESYMRAGATLQGEARDRWREVSAQLDSLTLVFGQNVQKATAAWSYQLNPDTDLEGLPGFVAEALKQKDYKIGLNATDYRPFMTYSSRRDLREMLYRAYNARCVGGEFDNTDNIRHIAALRQEKADLLGFETFAHLRLGNTMAHTPEAVNGLLGQLLDAYKQPALNEVKEVADFAKKKDGITDLQPWDFSYYSELLKTEKYNVNDALIKPYLPLERVKEGVFGLAGRLYGVTFHKLDVPVYYDEVECFEVLDKDSTYLGLLYTDFFPRDTKRPGAWMTEFKGQWREADGTDSRPHVSIVMSFSKPIGQPGDSTYTPALLTYDEATTFLHEFGHSLHGLLTKCNYRSLSGTSVAHDFVELPSQFNENFMGKKEFLDTFAADYKTGEQIPQELIDRLHEAQTYHAAYACVRQLSFGMMDMKFHMLGKGVQADDSREITARFPELQNVEQFEADAMAPTQVLPRVEGGMMAPTFTHIFSGGYAAGYYGYKWAEVLDADAFAVFEKEGLFNPETAGRFRHLLESGDTVDPAELYRQFKGSDPDIKALMRRDGIIK